MKYLDGFRNPDAARFIQRQIREVCEPLVERARTIRLMEVCGSHTMAIARFGIRDVLPDCVRLISGPGCPVCVTDAGYIDAALTLADRGVVLCTFGDMIRVPGSRGTLAEARSAGARVEICYSPTDALEIANAAPDREHVFLGIGFETTVPPVISLVRGAMARGLENLSVLTAFKLVPPALEALAGDPEVAVDGFILPAHVSAIIGANAYAPFVERHRIPCVVAGFEPLDILYGISELARQLAAAEASLVNQYSRVVKPEGNVVAQRLIKELLEPVDASWRGIGTIPGSGLGLKSDLARFDAEVRHGVSTVGGHPDTRCRCGDVLKGKILPADCGLFGEGCTPAHPVGPCMVSSEGSCAAYYKYSR